MAFHCEDRLSLDAALKNAAELVNAATDADLKVVILAGLADITHGAHTHQTTEHLVIQLVEFAHFCKAKCVDLTVCSIPMIDGAKEQKLISLIRRANSVIRSALHELGVEFLDLCAYNSEILSDGIQFTPLIKARVASNIGGSLCKFLNRDPQPVNFPPNSKFSSRPRAQGSRPSGLSIQTTTFSTTATKQTMRRSLGFHQAPRTRGMRPKVKEGCRPLLRENFSPSRVRKGSNEQRTTQPQQQSVAPLNTQELDSLNNHRPHVAYRSRLRPVHHRPGEFHQTVGTSNVKNLLQMLCGRLNAMQSTLNNMLYRCDQPPWAG